MNEILLCQFSRHHWSHSTSVPLPMSFLAPGMHTSFLYTSDYGVYQNHLKDWSKHRLLGFTPEFPVWVPRIRISNKLPSDVNDSGSGSTLSEHLSRAQVSSETHLYLTLCVRVCVWERWSPLMWLELVSTITIYKFFSFFKGVYKLITHQFVLKKMWCFHILTPICCISHFSWKVHVSLWLYVLPFS